MAKARKLAAPQYKTFRLQKRIKTPKKPLPSIKELVRQTVKTLSDNKRFFLTFTLLYALLSLLFVQASLGFANINQAKEQLGSAAGGTLQTSLVLYATLIGGSGQGGDQIVTTYQFIFVLVFGMAGIYGLRHMYGPGKNKVTVKESLYQGMGPLIPLLIVIAVIGLQLIPISVGSGLYATVVGTGLAITNIERALWVVFIALLGLLSLYLISGSIFAMFIATLPDMTPLKALRASRELTRHRRLSVIRKLVALPIFLFIVMGIIMVPFIIWLPAVASFVFYLLSALVLPVVLIYTYNMYRGML